MKSRIQQLITIGALVALTILTLASCGDTDAPEVDTDNDGIPDSEDNCSSLPGEEMYGGCPWYKVDACSGASPYSFLGANVKWATNSPYYYYGVSLPSDWRTYVDRAAATWNNVGTRLQIRRYTTVVNAGVARDQKNVVSFGPISGGDYLGRAYVWYTASTGIINEVDIVLNSAKPWSIGGGASSYDFYSTLVHEFGHFCGLDHVGDRTHTMYPSCPTNCSMYRTLCAGDRLGLQRRYP